MKRLSQPTGSVISGDNGGDQDAQIVRSAILVHAGENGQPMEFQSGDGPIKFDEARIRNVVEVHNAKLKKLAADYGGEDKIPMGAYEPILDSHADDSNDRVIGRLTGPLTFEYRDVPKVGKRVPCAIAQGITFLGKGTVDRVKDGRIYHLSIGINEVDNSLGETSTVVTPAAPGAMLLKAQPKKPKQDKGVSKMSDLKKNERLTRLSAMNESLTNLSLKAEHAKGMLKLTEKKNTVTHRLTALGKSGRLGRADYKNIMENKFNQLVSMTDSQLETTLSILESVSPDSSRIRMSAQSGSSAASDVMEMGRELAKVRKVSDIKKLRKEIAKDFNRLSGKKLVAMAEGEEDEDHVEHSKEMSGPVEKPVAPGKDEHVVPGQEGESELSAHLAKLGHHLASGDIEGAKACHAEMSKLAHGMKHMSEYSGDVKSEDYKAAMGELHKELDEMKTQMSRFGGMVQEMMSAEKEEGEHFGEISKEHQEVSA